MFFALWGEHLNMCMMYNTDKGTHRQSQIQHHAPYTMLVWAFDMLTQF